MDPFTLRCDAVSAAPRVLAFRGDEELGRCFEYDVCVELSDDDSQRLKLDSVLGEPATLTIGEGDSAVDVSGRVAEVELLEDVPSSLIRLRIVPDLWFLRRSEHNRVFVDLSFPDILTSVLAKAGLSGATFELRLAGSYPKHEHVCQYQESDLDFIHRWLEREGIYYYFDHGAPGSKLVFCDSASEHAPAREDAVAYHPLISSDEASGQHFRLFRASLRALPKEVGEADYNYLTPDAEISAKTPVAPELTTSLLSWSENEPDQGEAARVALLRAELQKSRRSRYSAKGREISIHAGFTFRMDRHPAPELNREYLAVRVLRTGQITAGLDPRVPFFRPEESAELGRETVHAEISAIASEVQYRLPRVTPWPLAGGLELGVVDGDENSEYSQIDEHGRYLVRLMMDENQSPAGRASTRVRMIQPHGGKQEGYHLPLRKGTEVLVAFIGGDPDRPVIAGAVPNALTPSPVTRANNTKNVVQTGGRSRLEVEDRDGQQYIDVSTPPETTLAHLGAHAGLGDHNIVLSTSGDGLIHTGTNRDITIGGVQNEDVQGDLTESYHSNQKTHVAGAFKETIDSGATQTIHAGLSQTITGGLRQSIHGGEERSVSGGTTETVNGSRTQTIVGATTETVSASQTQTITGGATVSTTSTYTVKADGGITLKTDGPLNMMSNTWLMNAAGGQLDVDNHFLSIASEDMRIFDFLFTPNGACVNGVAIALAATGVRLDFFTRKKELALVVLQNRGGQVKSGAKSKWAFAASFAFGFITFL